MAMLTIRAKTKGLAEAIARRELDALTKVELVLEAVGHLTVAKLRSLTNESRPPVKRGEPKRRAHPGHWADVTGQLANSYRFEVYRTGNVVTLALINGSEHAAHLERREGYFVLSGVMQRGGMVELAIREAVRTIAPGMRVK